MNSETPFLQLAHKKRNWSFKQTTLEALLCDFGDYPDVTIETDGRVWVEGGCMGEWMNEEAISAFLTWLTEHSEQYTAIMSIDHLIEH